jgi:hypothetical protein
MGCKLSHNTIKTTFSPERKNYVNQNQN